MNRATPYVASVLLSALLLFLLQPMLARLLLPTFGGSPAVWNTCMVFFQVLLLAGYAYAHGSLKHVGVKRQTRLHAVVLLLSLAFLPRALHLTLSPTASPLLLILAASTLIAGVPFFVLSTNSSLTQRWYSLAQLESSDDPFWLYAASNAGSLVALLGYPFIVEPLFGLHAQLLGWSIGYVLFALLCAALMFASVRRATQAGALASSGQPVADIAAPLTAPVPWHRRARWIARAAVASSLLLSVTMQISTDIVSAPLFWVLPLAIYLVTFIVAFSPGRRPPRRMLVHLTTIGIAICLIVVLVPTMLPLWAALAALLGTLFTGALVCHGDLADDRPSAEHLTDFYLSMAVGGAIGGIANSIVAPVVFSSVAEYPLTLAALALVLRPNRGMSKADRGVAAMLGLAMLIAAVMVSTHRAAGASAGESYLHWQFMPVPVLVVAVLLATRPAIFPLASGLTALFMIAQLHYVEPVIDQARSFFGVSRVIENDVARIMVHGVTVHGAQFRDSARRDLPVSYYYPAGPLGWTVQHMRQDGEIGVVGLGSGALAALTLPGQRLTYYEIDPLVESMARRDFTFLKDAKGSIDVRIGDGRQLLERTEDGKFDLLIVDAFSSDAIPMHMLTEEAIGVYLQKVRPMGLLVLHISNRYADLQRVFRGWMSAAPGRRVAVNQYVPTASEQAMGVLPTVAVAIARAPQAVAPLAATRQWYWLDADGPSVHWTDDHASLLSVLDKNVLKP